MKKILLLAFFACFITASMAQDWDQSIYSIGKIYPGYIINLDGEKVEGFIKAQSRVKNQTKVIFYTDANNKKSKVTYKPEDIKAYLIADKWYESIHYSGGLFTKPVRFNLMIEGGTVKTFIWYEVNAERTSENPDYFISKIIYQKNNEMPFEQSNFLLNYKKKMGELVKENQEIADKVTNGVNGYGRLSLEAVIREYNEWSENQNQ